MDTLEQVIRKYFMHVGNKVDWSNKKMSKILGVSVRTIVNYKNKFKVGKLKRSTRIKLLDEWESRERWG